jgi:hypothetical protein
MQYILFPQQTTSVRISPKKNPSRLKTKTQNRKPKSKTEPAFFERMDEDEEPRPGNFDRAWNDPPLFSYKANGQPPTTGPKLNKRVMYPVTAAGNSCFLSNSIVL